MSGPETLADLVAPTVTVAFDDCSGLDPVTQQMLRATALISALARSLVSLGFTQQAAEGLVVKSLGRVWEEAVAQEGIAPPALAARA